MRPPRAVVQGGITKLRYMQFRDRTSTSSALGFRLQGLAVTLALTLALTLARTLNPGPDPDSSPSPSPSPSPGPSPSPRPSRGPNARQVADVVPQAEGEASSQLPRVQLEVPSKEAR